MREIKIEGMSCLHCVQRVENALKSLGLQDVNVSLEEKRATFSGEVPFEKIKETIFEEGFEVLQ